MKITIIGAGNVGSQIALLLALNKVDEIVLVDIIKNIAIGKALDLQQSMACINSDVKVIGTNNYIETKNSDIVVITAGITRKPGMSREELLQTNIKIVREVTSKVVKYSLNSILIIVTNPLDVIAYVAYKTSKFPKSRVIGMAGVLDGVRMKSFISKELKARNKDIDTAVLGCHGDNMVPLIKYTKVRGKQIEEFLKPKSIDEIIEKTKNAGAEIVSLLNTSAFFAPAFSVVEMIKAIIGNSKKVMPCSVCLGGEYNEKDVFIGVPVRLGKNGVEEIVELILSKEEKLNFKKACDHIRGLIKNT